MVSPSHEGDGGDELPPLPDDFEVPDGQINHDVLAYHCRAFIDRLIQGRDATVMLRELAAGPDGPGFAVLAAKFTFEPVAAFIINEATWSQADLSARALSRFLVAARSLLLPP